MSPQRLATLHLALCAVLTLAACDGASQPAADVAPAKAAITIDESQLPATMRFAIDDLDTTKDPCEDFGGYVNAQVAGRQPDPRRPHAAGAPRDAGASARSRCSTSSPNRPRRIIHATGIEKIVGDFWATGMDEAKINAQGIAPLESRLATPSTRSPTGTASPTYLRAVGGAGRQLPVRLRPRGRLQELDDEHRLRHPGRPGPARHELLLRRGQDRTSARPTRPTSPRCSSCPASAPDAAAEQAKAVMAFETRLAKASKSQRGAVARRLALLQPGQRRPTPTS